MYRNVCMCVRVDLTRHQKCIRNPHDCSGNYWMNASFVVMLRPCAYANVQRILCLRRRVQIYNNNTTDVLLMKTMSSAKFNRVYFLPFLSFFLSLSAVHYVSCSNNNNHSHVGEESCYDIFVVAVDVCSTNERCFFVWGLDYFETSKGFVARWW